ncbi:MAG: hypothetical protein LC713_07985, partial [Actinobacteria bacterium]|nr:hypothetical protein [Actinomycetota bacterium]
PQAVFTCGAVFGGDSAEPSNDLARSRVALPYQPCRSRRARRALAVADLGLGMVAVAVLVASRRGHATVVDDGPGQHKIY